ncbi:MAG TPA: cell division protein FtsZ, partial [Kineosporiaceae bacterium]|nr:cell division protein FtsZ [Kineosporiaceae bacterium]
PQGAPRPQPLDADPYGIRAASGPPAAAPAPAPASAPEPVAPRVIEVPAARPVPRPVVLEDDLDVPDFLK